MIDASQEARPRVGPVVRVGGALSSSRPLPRPWWSDAPIALTWAGLLVVLGLWVANRGGQDLGTLGPGLTSMGRLLGLVAADLLLVQALLMARVPWVERRYGQDRLAHWHRLLGFASFSMLLAHVGLVTLGYAATDHAGVLGEAWDLVVNYPGMLLATAALGLLILVVVTSIKAARRRLRYESWHLLHLYAYLGVGLALPHQVWTGTDFAGSALARAYWWTLYAAAAGAVVVFRVVVPAWRTLRHDLRVSAVVAEGPGVVSVHLKGRALDRLPAKAGQFFLWRFLDGPGWSRAHPYSLSAAPGGTLRITVKALGDGSARLAQVRPGTRAIIEGPFGRLTSEVRRGRGVTVIGSGIGITPLRALLAELTYGPGEAHCLYRARDESEVIFRRELEHLAKTRGVAVTYLLGRRAERPSWLPGSLAHVEDADGLARLVPGIAAHDVYVCGPNPWMDAVRTAALTAGVPEDQIHLERFDW